MNKRTFDLELLQEEAETRGGELLSKKYINSTTEYLWRCKKGHKWKATALEVMGKKYQKGKGKWCPKCEDEAKNSSSSLLINLDDI